MANLKLLLYELKLIVTNINLIDYKNMSKNQSERKFLIGVCSEGLDKLKKIQTMSKNPRKLKLEKILQLKTKYLKMLKLFLNRIKIIMNSQKLKVYSVTIISIMGLNI